MSRNIYLTYEDYWLMKNAAVNAIILPHREGDVLVGNDLIRAGKVAYTIGDSSKFYRRGNIKGRNPLVAEARIQEITGLRVRDLTAYHATRLGYIEVQSLKDDWRNRAEDDYRRIWFIGFTDIKFLLNEMV